jgi:hypothetical protein
MVRLLTAWLAITGLFIGQASALEEGPRPQQGTVHSESSKSDERVPLPAKKPEISVEQRKAENVDPRLAAARAKCGKLLEGAVIDYQYLPSIKRGACGTETPILVRSIGADPAIVISPPATMNCTLAAALHTWFEEVVQPAAEKLGTSLVKVRNAASYKCRRRYGAANTKISEHAFGNAIDISEFTFASGQRLKVLGNWPYGRKKVARPLVPAPPLPNPRRVAEMLAIEDAEISRKMTGAIVQASINRSIEGKIVILAKADAHSSFRPSRRSATIPPLSPILSDSAPLARSGIATSASGPSASLLPHLEASSTSRADNGTGKSSAETPQKQRSLQQDEAKTFMHLIHADACRIFETVLGPNANAAHKDHFHFDMKKRRYVKICN